MKRLLLILSILIFSCSSNDSNDSNDSNYNNDETFLERYDGVVWQILDDSGEIGQTYVRFNNDTINFVNFYFSLSFNGQDLSQCLFMDDIFIEGSEITILINDGDVFAISETDSESTTLTTFTATNNGNVLEMELLDPESQPETISLPRASITEIPCPVSQ